MINIKKYAKLLKALDRTIRKYVKKGNCHRVLSRGILRAKSSKKSQAGELIEFLPLTNIIGLPVPLETLPRQANDTIKNHNKYETLPYDINNSQSNNIALNMQN